MDNVLLKISYLQPFILIQCDDLSDGPAFATMVIDRKYIPLGYISYARGVEAIIKASYIFNLEYEKSIQNILNYVARFVIL